MKYSFRQKKNSSIPYKILIGLTATVALVFMAMWLLSQEKVQEKVPSLVSLPELSTEGYAKISVDAGVVDNQGIIVLEGNCYQVTGKTEPFLADSIAKGIDHKIDFRPITHDLMKDAFDSMNIDVLMVKIVDLKNSTFIGKLIIKQGNKIVSLDSRPSDGIALAVRTGTPIYMKEDLLKQQGKYIC